ncbi:MAG: histidine kinase, partial [Desulfobacteraceae bacterium]
DQLRALAAQLTLAEQRERQRLAKVLHDHLQQLLVAAKYRLAALNRHIDPAVQQNAKEVGQLLDDSIRASRSLTAELSSPVFQEGGFSKALDWLAAWMADKHGLKVDLSLEPDLPLLAEDVKVLLFESIRELLFNTAKHAQAPAVTVQVRRTDPGTLHILVKDEGIGFDPTQIKPGNKLGGGFGLFSIRERLALIGGKLEIESAPNQGSRFKLSAPLDRKTAKS